MAHEQKRLRRGGLKQNLALPGEGNRAKIQGGIGQVQDQVSPIVSEKALEQPSVKPGGLRRTVGRVGRAIREVGLQPSAIATNLLTKGKAGGDRIVSPAITAGEVETATKRRLARKEEPRQIGTSVLTKRGDVDVLTGTKKPAPDIDFTRGSEVEVRVAKARRARAGGVQRRGRFDIVKFTESAVTRAGDLANIFTSPEFRAEQREARGVRLRRKGKRADVKLVNERIKALSSTLANIPEVDENEEIRNKITGQITDLITKGSVGTNDAVLNRVTKLKKAGFDDELITRIETAMGA